MKENQQQQSADLKTMGLKVTVPRLKILDLFQKLSESHEAGKRHLSAEEVYKLLLEENSDIGLATVYRVLTQFECRHSCAPSFRRRASDLRASGRSAP